MKILYSLFIIQAIAHCTHAQTPPPRWDENYESLAILKTFCPEISCGVADNAIISEILNNASKTHSMFEGCCLRCDCSDNCYLKGNCCPGNKRQESQSVSLHRQKCVQTFIKGNDPYGQEFNYRTPFENSTFILNHLRGEYDCDDTTQNKCLNPDKTIFDELNPVYSSVSGLNYRNKHCAECSGESPNATILWPAEIRCKNLFDMTLLPPIFRMKSFNNKELLSKLDAARCQIFWKPFSPQETEECVLKEDLVAQCNPYLLEPRYTFSRQQCALAFNEEQSLYNPIYQSGRLYANAFCAVCNDALLPDNIITAGNCEAIGYGMIDNIFSSVLDTNVYILKASSSPCMRFNTVCIIRPLKQLFFCLY